MGFRESVTVMTVVVVRLADGLRKISKLAIAMLISEQYELFYNKHEFNLRLFDYVLLKTTHNFVLQV